MVVGGGGADDERGGPAWKIPKPPPMNSFFLLVLVSLSRDLEKRATARQAASAALSTLFPLLLQIDSVI